jgi:cyclic pyranopterin phosphate synthase
MVDVSAKAITKRQATVTSAVHVSKVCADQLTAAVAREICTTARIAGINAAKKTWELIPLCHQINLTKVDVDIVLADRIFVINAVSVALGVTGVEMEAMTAAQVAALTIYDMIKASDPMATLGPTLLLEKTGGKSEIKRKATARKSGAHRRRTR